MSGMPQGFVKWYDKVASRYFDYEVVVPALASLLGARRRLLELGVGTGNVAIPLVKKGFLVTGVDASSEMLGLLREKAVGVPRLSCHRMDVARLDMDSSFDAAYSFSGPVLCFEHHGGLRFHFGSASLLKGLLAGLNRCLLPGGLFIIAIEPWRDVKLQLGGGYSYERAILSDRPPYTRRHAVLKDDEEVVSFEVEDVSLGLEAFNQELEKHGFEGGVVSSDGLFFYCVKC